MKYLQKQQKTVKINLGVDIPVYFELLRITGEKKVCLTRLINLALLKYVEDYKDSNHPTQLDEEYLDSQLKEIQL